MRRRHRTPIPTTAYFDAFTPLSVASLVAWYDFGDPSTLYTDAGTTLVTADADTIYQATDKSGSGKTILQTTAGSRPAYKTNILNGRSVARFDGTADYLQTASFTALTQPLSYFIVFKTTTVANARYFVAGDAAGKCDMYYDNVSPAYGTDAASGVLTTAGIAPDTSYHIISMVWNNTTNKLREDGTAGTIAAAGTNGTSKFTLGAYSSGILPLSGDIAEFIAYNSAISTANHNTIGNYLSHKWGITWNTV